MMKSIYLTIYRFILVILALGVSGYAFSYFDFKMHNLMFSKSKALLNDYVWRTMFYMHIFFGAIALLLGSYQFFKILRQKFLTLHKNLGKVYVFSVFLSGTAGLYVAFYATTGIVAQLGFAFLAIFWLYTNWQAYFYAKNKQIILHQYFMIRNYALTLAAVTLRIYLGVFVAWQQIPFESAYPIIAWACWLPNLLIAEVIIRQQT